MLLPQFNHVYLKPERLTKRSFSDLQLKIKIIYDHSVDQYVCVRACVRACVTTFFFIFVILSLCRLSADKRRLVKVSIYLLFPGGQYKNCITR